MCFAQPVENGGAVARRRRLVALAGNNQHLGAGRVQRVQLGALEKRLKKESKSFVRECALQMRNMVRQEKTEQRLLALYLI